ncbi:FAD-dependent monooxygenase [Bradyrhizobium sp. BRP22]|uniref:FAD-dependent monooxygenase n=1 Tax=Bradyrhizobium sp. BRP22 TaxID=2793821 RepID=UPI001CD7D613|nr:FAD-dependent monooxygenase [Bradyrhizobium sp. BRP22]MCA1456957.1 FAD-dependent monooxygenase [Bradyrhizobium sp. BRP22]
MGRHLGQCAVVIGAGIGGLSAAGALASYFKEIVVLERDTLPASAISRAGTPQDRHPHLLLAGGLQALGDILPGFEKDLARAGAVSINVFRDIRYERADVGALPQRDCGEAILSASRPLIEHVLRRRVAAIANVALRSQCRVTEIVPDATRQSVRFVSGAGEIAAVEADLVVDASGRGAPTLGLLSALGWERPPETTVGVDISYTTALLQPEGKSSDWQILVTLPDPRSSVLAGLILPIEGGRWLVALSQHGAPERPETWEDFLALSRQLNTPMIYNAICKLAPPDGLRHFVFDESRWRHFEQLQRLPRGILPVADSLCRFNPIYGQGMSVAAQQAKLLCEVLDRVAAEANPIEALQAEFLSEVGSLLQAPWNMGVNADFAYPGTRGERPERYEESRQFEAALFRAVAADPVVQRAFSDVLQLIKPFELLQDPDIRRRIEANAMA